MVNDCTTVSISDMSAVFKYYMVKNKSDTLKCSTTQYVLYFTILGGSIDPSSPPPLNDAPVLHQLVNIFA